MHPMQLCIPPIQMCDTMANRFVHHRTMYACLPANLNRHDALTPCPTTDSTSTVSLLAESLQPCGHQQAALCSHAGAVVVHILYRPYTAQLVL